MKTTIVTLPILLLLLAGTARADDPRVKTLEATIAKLEARVKKLEEDNARYAEALDFLQKVYVQQKAQQDAQDREELAPDGVWAVAIAADVGNNQVIGPANAPVSIVWVFDFADPYSFKMRKTIDEVMAAHAGKIRVVFKNLIVHPQATDVHKAACAAGKQKKFAAFFNAFWKEGYEVWTKQHDTAIFSPDSVATIAKGAGLDPKKLRTDMASDACQALIRADSDELTKFHINATPTFFVNGVVVSGAWPDRLVKLVDDKLAEATKSGVANYYDKVVMVKGEKVFRSKRDAKP